MNLSDQLSELLSRPQAITQGRSLRFANAGRSVTVRTNEGDRQAIAATDINTNDVTVLRDERGKYWALGPGASRQIGNRRIETFTQTTPRPKAKQPIIVTGGAYIAVLYRVRNGMNWEFYVGGDRPTPVLIATAPVYGELESYSGAFSLSGSHTPQDINDTSNPSDFRQDIIKTVYQQVRYLTINSTAQVQGTWTNIVTVPNDFKPTGAIQLQVTNVAAITQLRLNLSESNPSDTDSRQEDFSASLDNTANPVATQASNITYAYNGFIATDSGLFEFVGEATTTGSMSATGAMTYREIIAHDGWLSANGNTLYVGIRHDSQASGYQNVRTFSLQAGSGTPQEISPSSDDWQQYKAVADPFVQAPDATTQYYAGSTIRNRYEANQFGGHMLNSFTNDFVSTAQGVEFTASVREDSPNAIDIGAVTTEVTAYGVGQIKLGDLESAQNVLLDVAPIVY